MEGLVQSLEILTKLAAAVAVPVSGISAALAYSFSKKRLKAQHKTKDNTDLKRETSIIIGDLDPKEADELAKKINANRV